jgi:cysteine desulfurase
MSIYLDYNATTPCDPEVVAAMLPYFTERYGNPASPHEAGHIASKALTEARELVAQAIGSRPEHIVFTGSATEANNIALLGVARVIRKRRKIAVSAVEHKSVLEPARYLGQHGYTMATIPVDRNGVIDLEAADAIIDAETLLVSVQGANNETGVVQPVHEIARLSHGRGALCHCDAAQVCGKIPLNIADLGVDLASISAHKMYGPKGVGALVVTLQNHTRFIGSILHGGQQEQGLRPGTPNVPGIIGFGAAAQLVSHLLPSESERVQCLRDDLESALLGSIPGVWANGQKSRRLPGTISLTVPGIPADMLMANLPTACVGNGSACNSGAPDPSHVLLAMGLSHEEAESTVRISLGRYTTSAEIRIAHREINDAVARLQSRLGLPRTIASATGGNAP